MKRDRRISGVNLTIGLFLVTGLLAAYVLSIGPYGRLVAKGYIDRRSSVIYRPIGYVASKNKTLNDALIRYQIWWQQGF